MEIYPLRVKRKEGKKVIRCPKTGKLRKYECGNSLCKYFVKRLYDTCYCSHPDAGRYVEVGV